MIFAACLALISNSQWWILNNVFYEYKDIIRKQYPMKLLMQFVVVDSQMS